MTLKIQSNHLEDYLKAFPPVIQFDSPMVLEKINLIQSKTTIPEEQAKMAFEIARDEVHHSFDTQNPAVIIHAEDALQKQEGICFAKSHVLASLLRGLGIPAGFCYQRVLRKGIPDSGFALHGLNAVYLNEYGWFRLDPRGNKPGINAQFSIAEEKLAYPIRTELGEVDYPEVFTEPLDSVIKAMQTAENCQALFYNRPETL